MFSFYPLTSLLHFEIVQYKIIIHLLPPSSSARDGTDFEVAGSSQNQQNTGNWDPEPRKTNSPEPETPHNVWRTRPSLSFAAPLSHVTEQTDTALTF
ncbi:hypothetical protein SLE2022_249800 [Rubroshorea leprosula]